MSGSWCRIREYVEWSVIYLELEMSQRDVLQAIACRLMVTTEKASIHPHIHRNIHHHLIYPKVWIPMRNINCLLHWALLQITMWPVTPYGRAIDFNESDHGKPLKQGLVVCCITAPSTGDLHVQYIESEIDISLQGIPTYFYQAQ